MRKILILFGTRPEAIKMAPLILEFKKHSNIFETRVCVTGQHREMLDQVLDFFDIIPDYDLELMRQNQNLFTLTADIILNLKEILEDFQPEFVFVHGDTTTTMAGSLASYYSMAKICHIEAGLRTNNIYSPFPEEINRQITSRIATYHFAPTVTSKKNLETENIDSSKILITGNTVVDALIFASNKIKNFENEEIKKLRNEIDFSKKIILVTGHRRENHGDGFVRICEALREISINNIESVQIIYPVHLNPNVKNTVFKLLSNIKNIKLINPLSYSTFVWLMNKSHLIITDSGGVQEEAPSIGKPVLVIRDTTERPEAVEAGTVMLVGTNKKRIVDSCQNLLEDETLYNKMISLENPYGDGNASKKIVDFIIKNKIK